MADELVGTGVRREAPGEDESIVGTRDDLLEVRVEAGRSDFLLMALESFEHVGIRFRVDDLLLHLLCVHVI